MSSVAKRYFISAGNMDAVRGRVMPHLSTLPLWAQNAYKQGQSFAAPRVYIFKLNRSVESLKSGTLVQRTARIPQGAKGLVSVTLNGVQMDLPVSRLSQVE